MKKVIINFLIIIIIVIIIINLLILFNYYHKLDIDKKSFENLSSEVNTNIEFNSKYNNMETQNSKLENINFLLKENKDMFAWLSIEGTNIDYPIMKSDEYLYKDFNKNYSLSGTPFLDKNCDLNFENNVHIIHGHNMNNGTMFNSLLNYKNKEFFNKNKYIKLYTENTERLYEIYAICELDITNKEDLFFYKITNFKNEKDFNIYIDKINNNYILKNEKLIEKINNILLLSTCDNINNNNRIVIFALEKI